MSNVIQFPIKKTKPMTDEEMRILRVRASLDRIDRLMAELRSITATKEVSDA